MDENLIDLLKTENWDEIAPRLIAHAKWKCASYSWARNQHDLPKGLQAADIAMQAIDKLISGERIWDKNNQPNLLFFLKSVIDSLIWHLVSSSSHQNERPSGFRSKIPTDNDSDPQDYDFIIDTASSSDPTPENFLLNKENQARFWEIKNFLYELASGDEEVGMILLCMEEGIIKPKEIAEQLGLDVAKVNNAQKRLRRLATKIFPTYESIKAE